MPRPEKKAGSLCRAAHSPETFRSADKYLSKNFLYIFFSANGGETRLFPSQAAGHSGKKSRLSFQGKYRKLMVRYLLFRFAFVLLWYQECFFVSRSTCAF
ncbi:Uncharacterized protein dnm_053570 [Desulfonema magnum]|uniref:Uncharacterized protein n=1 Tax=Desulfonema magnum TaxID=45655 RepID=A0A975GPX1_9BACT|nr:Uncharacterized protein dnm_053570 [Desulfonema magnum]